MEKTCYQPLRSLPRRTVQHGSACLRQTDGNSGCKGRLLHHMGVLHRSAKPVRTIFDGMPHVVLEFCSLIWVAMCMILETRLTHELGWSEHFNQEACSITAIKIQIAFLATSRLMLFGRDVVCSIFDVFTMNGS
jgi:hypothetical protein